MTDQINFLPISLLENKKIIKEIDRTNKILGLGLGWHYYLDLIWIINEIESSGLKKGATILDAGAGIGTLQFLLSQRGYNVISVDFAPRKFSSIMKLTHPIDEQNNVDVFEHDYIDLITKPKSNNNTRLITKLLRLLDVGFINLLLKKISYKNSMKTFCLDMTNMNKIQTDSVDAVVSLSAIEHVDKDKIPLAVSEMNRVIKNGGLLCITTSAGETADWFHEPSKGWCFGDTTLSELFNINNIDWSDYSSYLASLKTNSFLRDHLHPFYKESSDNGMPWGVWDPKYVPVGIRKFVKK